VWALTSSAPGAARAASRPHVSSSR
jgi:hypothetical protein